MSRVASLGAVVNQTQTTEKTPLTISMKHHYPQSYETGADEPSARLIDDGEASSRATSTASTQSHAPRRGSTSSTRAWGGGGPTPPPVRSGNEAEQPGTSPQAQGSVQGKANSAIPLNRKRLLHNAVHMSTVSRRQWSSCCVVGVVVCAAPTYSGS